jgi:hypothetical protein
MFDTCDRFNREQHYVIQGVYTETSWFFRFLKKNFRVLKVSCILREVRPPPKFLGYLTLHRWGALAVLTQKCIDFLKIKLVYCLADIYQ